MLGHMDTVGFERHDHASCIAQGVAAVDQQCRSAGLQFTPIRRRVLEILLAQHRALGAYDILDVLRQDGLGSQPPVAYRALEFLVKNGFAHRIERLNAFISCAHPGQPHAAAFLICRLCNAVVETQAELSDGPLREMADDAGFLIECAVLEAEGVCPNCQTDIGK